MVIRHVGVWSAARIYGAIAAAAGLLAGLLIALIAMMGAGFAAQSEDLSGGVLSGLFGVGAIIAFPILYGVMGLIGGAIGAVLYNIVAGTVGGLEIDVE